MELWSRRKFFFTSLAGSALAGTKQLFGRRNALAVPPFANFVPPAQGQRPLIISSANGLHALDKGMEAVGA